MKQKYDFNRLINNIYHLGKLNDIPIAKLEKDIGLSKGYFYRNKIATKPHSIGIETVIAVAEYFNTDMEHLLFEDMSKKK